MDVADFIVNPSWCQISGLVISRSFGMVGLMQCMVMIKSNY
jgi:hypothetical protein